MFFCPYIEVITRELIRDNIGELLKPPINLIWDSFRRWGKSGRVREGNIVLCKLPS